MAPLTVFHDYARLSRSILLKEIIPCSLKMFLPKKRYTIFGDIYRQHKEMRFLESLPLIDDFANFFLSLLR